MKIDLKLWYGVSVNRKNREDLVEMSMTLWTQKNIDISNQVSLSASASSSNRTINKQNCSGRVLGLASSWKSKNPLAFIRVLPFLETQCHILYYS